MCFSPAASFSVGTALLAGGTYATAQAIKKDPRWVPLAAYPVAFGVQQTVEGAVWLDVTASPPESGLP